MPIHTPYKPESVIGEFGWLWQEDGPMGPEWALVYTGEDDVHDPINIVFVDDRYAPDDAEKWRGTPYLTCSEPTAKPGLSDALEITIRLADGESVSHSFGDPDAARAAEQAISDALKLGRAVSGPVGAGGVARIRR